ncbi:asparagine synthase (glutamine-hydrolyzing) [Bradyrhizobium embrapense]
MCGIFASLGFPPDRANIDIVSHRGPDGSGWKVFETSRGSLALGHRRLAIIDLTEAGHQPMGYADGRYWMVYNGEIYNYLELKSELEALGWIFTSHSDSEVLMAAYAQWGEDALPRLMGMFAFVVWDAREQRLFMARDRFGIKPLYLASSSRGIAAGSEIKQLLNLPGISRRMNVARMRDFLASGISEHTAETMFADVQQLRGGECVMLDLAKWSPGEALPIRRWYGILKSGGLELSEQEAGERFRDLLTKSVQLHLRSDVPVGSCLSGGLDSSSIVCLMDRLLREQNVNAPINTISACYKEKEVDERPFMEAVVASVHSKPHYVYPTVNDAIEQAEKITWHQDEPYGSTSIFAQWSVFSAARRAGVKVMLDGQGADEQLAGYHSGFYYYMADLVRRQRWLALARAVEQRRAFHGLSYLDQLRGLSVPFIPRRLLGRGKHVLGTPDWLASDAFRTLPSGDAFSTALAGIGVGPVRSIGDLCVAMTQGSNLTMLLHWEDRNSMAHGIEARVPFLDHNLVEFSIGLGESHKIVYGDTKRVLRRAMAGVLPLAVANRRDKLGFATPEQTWFRGPLRQAIEAGVEDTLTRFPGLLHADNTRHLTQQMLAGDRPLDFTAWRIVNVGIWGRVFGVTM